MSRTVDEILTVLDNLADAWKQTGNPTQHQVQTEALRELRAQMQAKPGTQQKGKR